MSGSANGHSSATMSAIEAQAMAQYINSFLDLVDNTPNDITRHLTQLHVLNNSYLKLINRMDTNIENYNKLMTTSTAAAIDADNQNNANAERQSSADPLMDKRRRLAMKLETQLIQIQELSDEKLKYSQLIIDLIETKAKELDLDYEEVVRFGGRALVVNGRDSSSGSINGNHNNKLNSNNASNHSTNGVVSDGKDDNKYKKSVNEDNSESRLNDKRLLPRRACAVKNGHTVEAEDESYLPPKATQNKIIKSSKTSYNKNHNFSSSMSFNFYRDMARRRAAKRKPNASKMATKIATETKKSSAKPSKQSVKKPKRKSMKRLFVSSPGSAAKQGNTNSRDVHKRVTKSSNSCSSTSSASSSSSSSSISSLSDESDVYETPKKTTTASTTASSSAANHSNGKRESSKRSHNSSSSYSNNNNSNNSNHKKSRANTTGSNATAGTSGGHSSKAVDNVYIGEAVDPNEDTYCLCGQVSYGDMICCDNKSCAIEWFHFQCVRLSHIPKGKWFCPKCRKGDKYSVPKSRTNSAKD